MLKRHIDKRQIKKRKGQSTVEYIILVAAVLAVFLVFLSPDGVFTKSLNSTLNSMATGVDDMSDRMENSRPPAP